MRQRGVSTVGAVVLTGLAGMLGALLMMDWMVVDVQVPEPDAIHILVPFPLVVGRIASSAIPDEALHDATVPEEVRRQRDTVLAAVRALADAPDATLVSVEAPDAQVTVAKEGDTLRIAVDTDDARVRCTVPIDGVLEALEKWDWETFDPGMIFDVLGSAPNGDLVRVEADDGTKVAITIW
jgi:hypothetical protein